MVPAAPPLIEMTDAAVNKVKDLLVKEGKPDYALRVYIAGGGCSGLSYGLAFDDQVREGDDVMEIGGIRVLVDPYSAVYLRGAQIDYVDSLMGSGFTVHNPNAVATCACGHSFNTSGDAPRQEGCCGH